MYLLTGVQLENKGFRTGQIVDTTVVTGKYSSHYDINSYTLSFHYYYLSVPLGLKYRINMGALKINLIAGMILDAPGYYGKRTYYPDGTKTNSHREVHAWNYDAYFQIGISWQFKNGSSISFDPGYIGALNYNDNDTLQGGNSLPYTCRFYSFIFPVTYYFTKAKGDDQRTPFY
ncbi:MAG: hypothetical protein ACHQRM_09755 [Bacteroidia bacterium]